VRVALARRRGLARAGTHGVDGVVAMGTVAAMARVGPSDDGVGALAVTPG
jgi:hypothetical protein